MRYTVCMEIMTIQHPRWQEFIGRLADKEGCNFREVDGKAVWDCDSEQDRPRARAILTDMGFDVEKSLLYFEEQGGYCDCEIVLNVEH